jgi:LuxR family maltose regulon positive regulatory protein
VILRKKTEGWIAGLQLTALSIKGQGNISEYLERMAGDNRYIMDYLLEEVLQQQSQQERDFLLCTSILNRFNAPLCNFMLGIDNSQEIIGDLERNNMFIIPLDNERNWFRYHHLFASLLQQRLALKFKNKLPELHNSASQWYENYDQLVFALEHSLAAGNKEKSIDHFANVINHLWETSQYLTILQFGRMFTHEEIVQNVGLCLNYFWILFQSGEMDQAEIIIYKLKNRSTDKAVLAMVRVCINTLKITTGDIESSYTFSELAIQNIKEDVDYWTIFAYLSLAEAHLLRFELKESFESFIKAARSASKPQFIYFEMINRTRSSFVLWTMGDFAGAYKEGKDMLDKFNAASAESGVGFDVLSSIVHCLAGNFLINTNQIEGGLQKSIHGYELSKKTSNALLISISTALLAEGYYLAGEYNKAITLLEELDAIPYKQATIFLCILSDLLKSKVYPLTNKLDQLKQLFERDVKADKNNAFETIVNSIAKARYQIAEGKIHEAIALLQKIAEKLELANAYGLITEVNILQARAHSAILEQQKAIDYLFPAMLRTQSVGLIRMYINEGEEIEELVKEIKSLKRKQANKSLDPLELNYINSILQAFEKEKSRQKIAPDEDELSSRELDTLNLLVLGLSNQEIAAKLFISNNTVKTHVRNILFKLEAKNRNDAVLKAKEKGIVPE